MSLEGMARRIGMEWLSEAMPPCWRDVDQYVEQDELRDYLLTGDRPLRWLRSWIAEGDTDPAKVGRFVDIRVYASGVRLIVYYIGPHNGQRFEADTLEHAIIALAERIEGEGRE